jgi:glycogen debranching enzyme
MSQAIQEAKERALYFLEKCSTSHGFFAAYPGYDAVWARDSMIMSMGSSVLGKKFESQFKKSLITLSSNQSPKGQIPNSVDKFSRRKSHVDFKSIDSSLWFIIGHYIYKQSFGSSLFRSQSSQINKALTWLSYQDMGEDSLLEQLPTTDWQDSFPHKYGHTINTQALWYKVLKLSSQSAKAKKVKDTVNNSKDDKLWFDPFYIPYRWKNHNDYKEKGDWFDSLGNILAILFDLASPSQSEKILKHIKQKKIDQPFPVKAIFPPITPKHKDWQPYYKDSEAGTPYHYLNGGIWSYIGGFYILALIKQKKFDYAYTMLEKLAEANMLKEGNYSEWLHGKTGKASDGGGQGWNAAMFLLALESFKRKRVLI